MRMRGDPQPETNSLTKIKGKRPYLTPYLFNPFSTDGYTTPTPSHSRENPCEKGKPLDIPPTIQLQPRQQLKHPRRYAPIFPEHPGRINRYRRAQSLGIIERDQSEQGGRNRRNTHIIRRTLLLYAPFTALDIVTTKHDPERKSRFMVIKFTSRLLVLLISSTALAPLLHAAGAPPAILAQNNLVAWCVVPFDASKRGPEARASMLKELGFTKLAYDWRDEHIPTFEAEIIALRDAGIDFFAMWGMPEQMLSLFEKYTIAPQLWVMIPAPPEGTQEKKVEAVSKQLQGAVDRARTLGCKLGLYNHGGWQGEPENMVAVCEWLRTHGDADHVGIVYNFHHGHDHMARFETAFALMKPYLLCLNVNGMVDGANPLILPVGEGQHEVDMLRAVIAQGYMGPIGILDHRAELDTELSLKENLVGLEKVRKALTKP